MSREEVPGDASEILGVRPRSSFAIKVKIGAAFAAGLIIGGTGLAAAGALPAPAQRAAHSMFSTVGVGVPDPSDTSTPPQRYDGPECGGTYRNHGQYVRTHHQDPKAAQSSCGKPLQATGGSSSGDEQEPPENHSGEPPGNGHGHEHGHGQGGNDQSGPGDEDGPSNSQSPGAPTTSTTTTLPAPTSTSTTTTTVASTSTSTTSSTTSTTLG